MLTELYRAWLIDYWQNGDESVAEKVLAADLVDHNRVPEQPAGRDGDIWAARAIRKAFPDAKSHWTSRSKAATWSQAGGP